MKIGIYYVVSTTASGVDATKENMPWIKTLEEMVGVPMEVANLDNLDDYDLVLDFIGSGGSEGYFLRDIDKLKEPYYLLTTGASNSLAASMEILSYLRQNNLEGEIIHGSDEYVARRIKNIITVEKTIAKMDGFTVGRVGKPSDWLIASDVDPKESKEYNNINIVDISMEEFIEEINKHEYVANQYTESFLTKKFDEEEKKLALYVYGALRRLVDKYHLDGVTVRCFDLLTTVKSTSCVALAILNSEGIYAACEGDVPALLSMAVLGELSGKPVFQANPSKIMTDTNEIIFAHCTLPITMPTDYELMTHFESNIGVAFRGKIKEGPITVFKCDGLLNRYFVTAGELVENLSRANLCRTQVRLKLEESVQYFLTESIGNHHIIVEGDVKELVDEFFAAL